MPVQDLPMIQAGWGLKTPFGITMPPGGKVAAYVRSTGAQDGDDVTIGANLVQTLAAGLARCRSGMYDTVFVLPGHVEAVTTLGLASLVATTRVVGLGVGTSQATFNWGATTSQWAISVANTTWTGLRLAVSGAVVVKGIVVTGAHTTFDNNVFVQATGAALKATIMFETDTGADYFTFKDNYVYGTATHNSDDVLHLKAATTNNSIVGNYMQCSSTAITKGLIHVAAASLNGRIERNTLYNTHTGSTACIYFADVASDGICSYNTMACTVGTGTAPAATGVVLAGTNTLYRFNENYSTPTKNTSGLVTPVVDS